MTDEQPRARVVGSKPPSAESQELLKQIRQQKDREPPSQAQLQRLQEAASQMQQDAQSQSTSRVPLPGEEEMLQQAEMPLEEHPDMYSLYGQTLLDNSFARKEVEKSCEPIDFSEVLSGRIRQRVPIHPEYLVVVFQTISNKEKLFALNKWRLETGGDTTSAWSSDLLSTYLLSLSLHSVNEQELPSLDKTKEGAVDVNSFQRRVDFIGDMGEDVVESMVVNWRWFKERVQRSLRRLEPLKNG